MTDTDNCIVCNKPSPDDDSLCYGCMRRIHEGCEDKICDASMGKHDYEDHLSGSDCGPCDECVASGKQ